jgi:hypothetical protein
VEPNLALNDRRTALLLCLVLTVGWGLVNWGSLSNLWLPDTDDMVRLQQVRDWMAGQGFFNLNQHRLSPPDGLPMHWSRLADLLPAGAIAVFSSMTWAVQANIYAVIAVPAILFLAYLLATARLYRAIDDRGEGFAPLVVAALAFPVMGLFQPGRIDHHGLQVVLFVLAASAVVGKPGMTNGVLFGACMALSLATGLEMAPFFAVLAGGATLLWITNGSEERMRMIASGLTLAGLAAISGLLLIPAKAPAGLCDSLNMPLVYAIAAAGGSLAFLGLCSGVMSSMVRTLLALAMAGGVGFAAWTVAPQCLADPYAGIDPIVAKHWLGNVEEARGLLTSGLSRASIGHAGLVIVALLATLWAAMVPGDRRLHMIILGGVLLASLGIMLFQLRGAYAGVAIASAPLGLMINSVRDRLPLLIIPAWLISIGIVYDQVPRFALPEPARKQAAIISNSCSNPVTMKALMAMRPPARIIAPMDFGPYGLALTRHSFYAAPYHRNNKGNRLMFDVLLGDASSGRTAAIRSGATHVLVCQGSTGLAANSLARHLETGAAPGWLARVPLNAKGARLYRVVR